MRHLSHSVTLCLLLLIGCYSSTTADEAGVAEPPSPPGTATPTPSDGQNEPSGGAGAGELLPRDGADLDGVSIFGQVLNEATAHAAIESARVWIAGDPDHAAITDAEGRYELRDLAPGSYALAVMAGDSRCSIKTEIRNVVVTADYVTKLDVTLSAHPDAMAKKVLVLNFDPIVAGSQGQRLHEAQGWHDPRELTAAYVNDLLYCSGNQLWYQVVEWIDVDAYPAKVDGFSYNAESYERYLATGTRYQPDLVDYLSIIDQYEITDRVNRGEIDEVIWWGGAWFGFYESQMVGPKTYWVNSPGLRDPSSTRPYVIMGLNYQRGVAEALHSYGHRTESILTRTYGGWNKVAPSSDWDIFAADNIRAPGKAGCGNVHYPANGTFDYDYSNFAFASSRCRDFQTWPDLRGRSSQVNASEWALGADYHRGYLKYWYSRIPRAAGLKGGKQANWWKYIADFNAYPESAPN